MGTRTRKGSPTSEEEELRRAKRYSWQGANARLLLLDQIHFIHERNALARGMNINLTPLMLNQKGMNHDEKEKEKNVWLLMNEFRRKTNF